MNATTTVNGKGTPHMCEPTNELTPQVGDRVRLTMDDGSFVEGEALPTRHGYSSGTSHWYASTSCNGRHFHPHHLSNVVVEIDAAGDA